MVGILNIRTITKRYLNSMLRQLYWIKYSIMFEYWITELWVTILISFPIGYGFDKPPNSNFLAIVADNKDVKMSNNKNFKLDVTNKPRTGKIHFNIRYWINLGSITNFLIPNIRSGESISKYDSTVKILSFQLESSGRVKLSCNNTTRKPLVTWDPFGDNS